MMFEPGQLVTLRCGGPVMMVAGFEDNRLLGPPPGFRCYWQVQNSVRSEILPETVLMAYEAPAESSTTPSKRS